MRFSSNPQKVIRFDPIGGATGLLVSEEPIITPMIAPDGKWVGIKWAIHLFDKQTKDEVFGALIEDRKSIEIEEREKDFNDLVKFAENSFVNVEMYIHDNLPPSWLYIELSPPNYTLIAEKLLGLLDEVGIYDNE